MVIEIKKIFFRIHFYYNHLFATDYDQDSCDTFKRNISGTNQVICSDIRSLDIKNLPYVDSKHIVYWGTPEDRVSFYQDEKKPNLS